LPTSVLLAVLAAAGLLALAPALVRRYDATERLEAERARSTARVLSRIRRRRTVPGRRPVNPPLVLLPTVRIAAPPPPPPVEPEPKQRALSVVPRSAPPARRPARPRYSTAVYRRRRVLAALVLLNTVELIGIAAVGPGFWVGFAVTGTLLLAFVVHLRNLALADRRRRRAEARREAWLAAEQAEVRREQDRRAAERRAAARRMAGQRELLRRPRDGWSAPPTVSYRRTGAAEYHRDEAAEYRAEAADYHRDQAAGYRAEAAEYRRDGAEYYRDEATEYRRAGPE
jgi:hypothetical protein